VTRREKIFSLDEYCDIMVQSASRPRPVLSHMADKMCDISQLQSLLGLTKRDANLSDEKVLMRDKVKWIKVTEVGSYDYRHSFNDNERWKTVSLVKAGSHSLASVDGTCIADIPVLPVSARAVKQSKLLDIKQ